MGMMGPMSGYLGHGHSQGPVPPCSPGMNSMHDDYPSEGNPPWSRTPSSPVGIMLWKKWHFFKLYHTSPRIPHDIRDIKEIVDDGFASFSHP